MPYRIKGWDKFQHYKDRSPPWIRLHRSLLDDYDFHCLPDASRALAPMMWLLASDNTDPSSGIIGGSDEKIAFRLRLGVSDYRKAVKPLIDNGFIECYPSASATLAVNKQDATPETETEGETEGDKIPPISPHYDFPEVWVLYPKKVARTDAEKAYNKAIKKGIHHAAIIAGLRKHVDHWQQWPADRKRFIPNAATWLNGGRWDDQLDSGYKRGQHSGFEQQDYYAGTEGFIVT